MTAAGALEAVERILNRGGEAEEVLRSVLDALHARGVPYAAIRFEGTDLDVGHLGAAPTRSSGPVTIAVDDETFVERVATLIRPYLR